MMDAEKLAGIVSQHREWLFRRGGARADLTGADLTGADLRKAVLRKAVLRKAVLRKAVLAGADLRDAVLRKADLRKADLRKADLRWADLRDAVLRDADLAGAVLRWANLTGADLGDADLGDADLAGADLAGADLAGADLTGAVPNWSSHDLIAEYLVRAAGDDAAKRDVAGLVLASRDWCWDAFLSECEGDPLLDWALDVLAAHVRDGDDAPEVLSSWAEKLRSDRPDGEEAP